MELHTLKPSEGSVKSGKRIARGQGSGRGGTSTRGHKGAKSRSGWSKKKNFEGGQMPIQMRLPKRGFKNHNRKNYVALNAGQIQFFADKFGISDFTREVLVEKGIVRKNDLVKLLGSGELSAKINITVNAATESGKSKVEANGGTVNVG